MSYFSKEISDVFNELGCDKNGLESKNIEKLHEKYGYNSLEEKEKATASKQRASAADRSAGYSVFADQQLYPHVWRFSRVQRFQLSQRHLRQRLVRAGQL